MVDRTLLISIPSKGNLDTEQEAQRRVDLVKSRIPDLVTLGPLSTPQILNDIAYPNPLIHLYRQRCQVPESEEPTIYALVADIS